MRLQAPNRKALTLLMFGLASLLLWWILEENDTDTSWLALVQKIALLGVGGVMTIFGLNLTWKSMQRDEPPDDNPPSQLK